MENRFDGINTPSHCDRQIFTADVERSQRLPWHFTFLFRTEQLKINFQLTPQLFVYLYGMSIDCGISIGHILTPHYVVFL